MNYYPYLAMIAISCLTIKNAVKRNPPENRSIPQLVLPQSPTGQQGVKKRERTPYFLSFTKKFPRLRFPFNARADYSLNKELKVTKYTYIQKKYSNMYSFDKNGNNTLQLAIMAGQSLKEIKWLVEELQISINHKNHNEKNAFLLAAQRGNLEILQFLKEKGADVNTVDDLNKNALHWAIQKNHSLELIEWLIDVGVDKNAKGSFYKENGQYHKSPPFIQAAVARNLPLLKLLLKKGAYVHAINNSQNNALHEAILAFKNSKDMAIIKWLIEVAQVSISHKNNTQETAFLLAAKKGDPKLLQFLKEKGAKVNDVDSHNRNALDWALYYSHPVSVIKWLIDVDVAIDGREIIDSSYHWAIHPFLQASQKGNLPVLKLLLEKGANALATDQEGKNALYYVINERYYSCDEASEYTPIAEWLIDKAKLSVDSKSADGETPFIYAAEYGDLDIMKCLLAKGADALATDYHGKNALHVAITSFQSTETIEWLIDQAPLLINAKGADGKTGFMYAAEEGNVELLRILKNRGADIYEKDNRGYNALWYARNQTTIDCLKNECELRENWIIQKICSLIIYFRNQYQ